MRSTHWQRQRTNIVRLQALLRTAYETTNAPSPIRVTNVGEIRLCLSRLIVLMTPEAVHLKQRPRSSNQAVRRNHLLTHLQPSKNRHDSTSWLIPHHSLCTRLSPLHIASITKYVTHKIMATTSTRTTSAHHTRSQSPLLYDIDEPR